jgi:2-phospho-L-lactate guanylyltransferase
VLVAPTHDGGTGALLRRPADVIAPAFGVASAAAHLRAARQAGVRAGLIWRPGLARDIDHPADLDRYAGTVADGGLRAAWFHETRGGPSV